MEPKRINLVPVDPVQEPKKAKEIKKTFRFSVALTESTDKTCPEFSFHEMVKSVLEEDNADEQDPFAKKDRDEADKLAAIARAFEDKYTDKTGKKRKRVDRLEDIVDLGDGYDLDDPFIDNTEAYDEIVPCNMTTKHGGFYINSGALDFKFCSDSEDDFQVIRKKKKKRVLTSDSEVSETGEKKKKKKKKLFKDGELVKKKKLNGDPSLIKKRKKLVSSEKIKMAKLKKGITPSGPKNPTLNGIAQTSSKSSSPNPVSSAIGDKAAPSAEDNKSATPVSENKQSPVINLVSSENETEHPTSPSAASRLEDVKTVKVSCEAPVPGTSVSGPATAETETVTKPKPEIPILPDTLSLKTISNIDKMKEAANTSEERKGKFFTPEVNDKLLQVEKETRQMKPGERTAVYSHLAAHLPCTKDTLIKRAKKLVTEQQDDRLREPISKLREAVIAAMPALIEKHQAECALADQKRQQQQQQQQGQQPAQPGVKDKGNYSNESEDENSQEKIDTTAASNPGDKQKRVHAPRKKFEWTPHIRSLLCDVVRTKMEHFETTKGRAQTAEEYLRAFLDAEVKPIWPAGWVQTRMLFKESRDVHAKWTNPTVKPKKLLVPGATASRPSSNANTPISNQNTPVSGIKKSASGASLSDKTTLNVSPQRVFASPDLSAKSAVSKIEHKAEDKAPTLLDYASNSYTAVAKSKQNAAAAASAETSSVLNNPSLLSKSFNASPLTNSSTAAKSKPPQNAGAAAFDADFMKQYMNFTTTLTSQQQQQILLGAQAQSINKQDNTQGKSPANVAKQMAANSSKTMASGQGKGVQLTTKGNTGSANIKVVKQPVSQSFVKNMQVGGQLANKQTKLSQNQMQTSRPSPQSNASASSQKHSIPQQLAHTQQSSVSPRQPLSTSPAKVAGLASPGVLNLSLSPKNDKYFTKSDKSAHNTSADSDDIPLANFSSAYAAKAISKPSGTLQTGSASQTVKGINRGVNPPPAHTSSGTLKPSYQQTQKAVKVTGASTGAGVQAVPMSPATAQNVSSGNITPQQQSRTVSPSQAAHQKLQQKTASAALEQNKFVQEYMKAQKAQLQRNRLAISAKAHSQVPVQSPSANQTSKVSQSPGQKQIPKPAASQVSRANQLQVTRSPQGQISRPSQSHVARSPQNPVQRTSQSPVSRSSPGHVANISHSSPISRSPHGPIASSSPRPASKSPQAGSQQSWLPGDSRSFSGSSYNAVTSPSSRGSQGTSSSYQGAGLALLDIAKATTAQALSQAALTSPDRFSQAAASLFNQSSPLTQQSVTSPLHASPQQRGLQGAPAASPQPPHSLLAYRFGFPGHTDPNAPFRRY